MHARIQKWGNSLALRIPKALADEVRVDAGCVVDISVERRRLVVRRRARPSYRLDDLLRQLDSLTIHGEVPTGHRVGREAW